MNRHKAKGSGIVEVIVIAIVAGLLIGGGWYVWRVQNKASTNSNQSQTHQKDVSDATFSRPPIPFTFKHPHDWTVTVDKPLQNTVIADEQYSVKLASPGIETVTEPIGGETVKKGARIIIWSTKTNLKTVEERFVGIYSKAKDRKNITVAQQAAIEYEFGYEGQPAHIVELIKNGRLYTLSYTSENNERTSGNFKVFEQLISTFAFQ